MNNYDKRRLYAAPKGKTCGVARGKRQIGATAYKDNANGQPKASVL